MVTVYKICPQSSWRAAEAAGAYAGSPADERDGFIHLSTAAQVPGTLARHFAGQHDLMLVAVDAGKLGDALRWEPSRDGALFPHVYGVLPMAAVLWATPLATGADGAPLLPEMA